MKVEIHGDMTFDEALRFLKDGTLPRNQPSDEHGSPVIGLNKTRKFDPKAGSDESADTAYANEHEAQPDISPPSSS